MPSVTQLQLYYVALWVKILKVYFEENFLSINPDLSPKWDYDVIN